MWWMIASYVMGMLTAVGVYKAWIEWWDYQWRVKHDSNRR